VGSWLGWKQTAVENIQFLQYGLHLRTPVLMVSWHGKYVDCSVLGALLAPAVKFAIRLIVVEWLRNKTRFSPQFGGFRS